MDLVLVCMCLWRPEEGIGSHGAGSKLPNVDAVSWTRVSGRASLGLSHWAISPYLLLCFLCLCLVHCEICSGFASVALDSTTNSWLGLCVSGVTLSHEVVTRRDTHSHHCYQICLETPSWNLLSSVCEALFVFHFINNRHALPLSSAARNYFTPKYLWRKYTNSRNSFCRSKVLPLIQLRKNERKRQ